MSSRYWKEYSEDCKWTESVKKGKVWIAESIINLHWSTPGDLLPCGLSLWTDSYCGSASKLQSVKKERIYYRFSLLIRILITSGNLVWGIWTTIYSYNVELEKLQSYIYTWSIILDKWIKLWYKSMLFK